jgi:hypothetical protein
MMNLRKLRYNISNCEIQDWVQLPTKPEMDAWRDIHTPNWRKEYKVVTEVVVTPTIERVVVSHD